MLQTALSILDKTKSAYLRVRQNNPVMLSGDFNLKLHLHRKDTPGQSTNASADGKFSVALIDIATIGMIVSLVSVLAGIFALIGRLIRKVL